MEALVLTSAAVLAYTYVGYPLLIATLARLWPSAVAVDYRYQPSVSVLVPVHNGAATLEHKIESIIEQDYPQVLVEILIYLDGCRDASGPIARRLARRYDNVKLAGNCERRGKPTALNLLASRATGDVLVLTHVRQALAPNAIRSLVAALADPEVGCASGHLVLRGFTGAGLYWRYETWIRNNESKFQSTIGCTGPLYAMRRELFAELPEGTILDDVWLPVSTVASGLRCVYVPAAIATDDSFEDGREFGRKTRTLAGGFQLFKQLPWLLAPWRNPLWLQTISHKLLRLISPWVLVLLATSTAAAVTTGSDTSLVVTFVALGQVGFYGLAVLGHRSGRFGAAAKSFVLMNVAAVVGLYRLASGRQKVTW